MSTLCVHESPRYSHLCVVGYFNFPDIKSSAVHTCQEGSMVAPLLGDPHDPSSIKHNDTDKADVLQHQFCRVFTREHVGDIPIIEPRTAEKLAAVEVTPNMALKRLMKLKVGKS